MSDYQRFQVDQPMLLRTFLSTRVSQKELKSLKYKGGIRVNGQPVTVRYALQVGDVVELFYPDERENSRILPWHFPIHIIYEDEALLVVYKPAGMPSIPTRHYANYTLTNALMAYYERQRIPSTVHLVSRLDKDTAGLILVAKSRRIHRLLDGRFTRRYRLWVEGKMYGEGLIDVPIMRAESSIKRFVHPDGRRSLTYYRVLYAGDKASLVEAELKTGRTHQIRVHFAYLGHPLLGDRLYGKAHPQWHGQALLSYHLVFCHPVTQKEMRFTILPETFSFKIENQGESGHVA